MLEPIKYKFITVRLTDPPMKSGGKPVYTIVNNRQQTELGGIMWHTGWRQWVASFESMTIWSDGCLADVRDAMRKIATAEKAPI